MRMTALARRLIVLASLACMVATLAACGPQPPPDPDRHLRHSNSKR